MTQRKKRRPIILKTLKLGCRKVKRRRPPPKHIKVPTFILWNLSPSACALKMEIECLAQEYNENMEPPQSLKRACLGVYPSFLQAREAALKYINEELEGLSRVKRILEGTGPPYFSNFVWRLTNSPTKGEWYQRRTHARRAQQLREKRRIFGQAKSIDTDLYFRLLDGEKS